MFKSIEYRLYLYMILLIAAIVMSTLFAIRSEYIYMALFIGISFFLLDKLRRSYNKFNKNILFLLNALDNGDYSFSFAERKLSRREHELNRMMNRIKEILSKARKEVIDNEKFLSVVVESVSTGIIIMDENNMVIQINRQVNKLLGLSVFTHINQLANIDKSLPNIFSSLELADTKTIKIENEREEIELSIRASKITLQGKQLKIITLNNIGSELDYKEMDSWIRLIRVMTHEIMNSIAPVTSLTDTLLSAFSNEKLDKNDILMQNTMEALETINTTAKGLISFVNSYRQFTGIPKPQLSPTNIQSIIRHSITLETTKFEEEGIKVTLDLPKEPTIILLDESQILQVLLNLVKNATESFSSNKDRQLIIKLSVELNKTYLDIYNNGQPISEEILPNIFIPFFTTKHSGTGIGLSVSRYIMRLHGGTLSHFTKEEWTVFRMIFYDLID